MRWQAMLDHIVRVDTDVELNALLAPLCHIKRPMVLAFVNAHAMNSMVASIRFFDAVQSADIVLRDGSGMATLYKMLSLSPGLNLNGTDLIPRLIRQFDGHKIALFGTQEPYLSNAKIQINNTLAPHSELILEHGFLDAEAYVKLANKHQPTLIVLGMGMPKQEEVAVHLRAALKFPCLIVCGGAIIDFLGGKTVRAPIWVQQVGIEWLFRLALEPRRLFRRYVIGNPVFLSRAISFTKSMKQEN